MSRYIFTGFFVFVILFQSMDRFGMIAFYVINKEYITELFCVNKSRPELGCEGKCFLMQKLNRENQQDDPIPSQVPDAKEIHLYPIQKPVILSIALGLHIERISHIAPPLTDSFVFDIFHPPQLS